MRPVDRSELLDWATWSDRRDELRPRALAAKELRRVVVGPYLCFLFENRDTVRYQVQEMMRVERIVREKEIQHELDTYNELLGKDGGLGCSLLIGVPDEAERARRLAAWLDLNPTLYVRVEDGTKVRATWDPRQVGDDRLSAVQYLQFPVGGRLPVAVGCDHEDPEVRGEVLLSEAQRLAFAADLGD